MVVNRMDANIVNTNTFIVLVISPADLFNKTIPPCYVFVMLQASHDLTLGGDVPLQCAEHPFSIAK